MDLDAFLDKKSKKLAGGKKKAKTGELSEKQRAELGLDVFGGLEGAKSVTPVPAEKPAGAVKAEPEAVASPTGSHAPDAASPSDGAPVEAAADAGAERDDGDRAEVFVRVVKTSEKKAKGWDAVKPTSGSVGDLLARAVEKSGPRKFVARGKGDSTGPLGSGATLSSADLPSLEDIVSGTAKKAESSPAAPTEPASAETTAPGAYKPPTDRPSAGAYQPPTDKPSTGAYKPPTDRPSAGAYKPPTDKPSTAADALSSNETAEGAPMPPADKPSTGAYKPPQTGPRL
ncbi:translation initiation factor IF-2, partial [Trypanosoma conorhini]